ncbi:MAG: YihY family inner membrane protein [Alphaproteobacteria bacterium]
MSKSSKPTVAGWRDLAGLAGYALLRFRGDRCLAVAASLSYTTLLAIVPLAAVGLATFAAFPVFEGVQETLQKFLFANFVPAAGEIVRENLTKFIANTGQLTAIGAVFLAITALMLLSTIEDSFNVIWRQSVPRRLTVRLMTYWAILTLTPLLIGGSLALSSYIFALTKVMHIEAFEGPLGALVRFLPFVLLAIGFALLYVIMPNRPVRWRHALAGGLAAAALFQLLKFLFVLYVTNFPSFETIYGAVSAMPLFLIWMYVTWCAVLVGAELCASIPEWRAGGQRDSAPAMAPGERLASALSLLAALSGVSKDQLAAGEAMSEEALAEAAGLKPAPAADLIERLIAGRYLARTTDDSLVLCRDLGAASLYDLADAMGLMLGDGAPAKMDPPWRRRLTRIIAEVEQSSRKIMAARLGPLFAEPSPASAKGQPARQKKRPG